MSQEFGRISLKNGVNLALGGGGAKGFVHLGVVEALAEAGIEIKAIVGTSIGAIIGALFAHYSTSLFQDRERPQLEAARAVTELFLRENFWRYADWNVLSGFTKGLLGGTSITEWLKNKLTDERTISPIRFSDLKFPLSIIVTDAHNGDCLILNAEQQGSMFVHLAVRASVSIPWIFREIPLDVSGRPHLCWDGGPSGNCRFDLANRLYPGRPTLASSLTYRGDVVTTHSSLLMAPLRPLRVFAHVTSIMMRAIEVALREAIPADERANTIFVEPRLEYSCGRVSTYDFKLKREYREELVENGRRAVRDALCSLS